MDRELFLTAVDRYKNTVFRVALNYFGNTYDAEDALQEVMLKLYANDKPFDGDEHIRNWLIRVTVNICKNTLRAPWRKRTVSYEDIDSSIVFEQKEDGDLYRTVMDMPEKYRSVLYFFYYEDLSVKEISDILRIRVTTVTTRLSRARNLLKTTLTEVNGDE